VRNSQSVGRRFKPDTPYPPDLLRDPGTPFPGRTHCTRPCTHSHRIWDDCLQHVATLGVSPHPGG